MQLFRTNGISEDRNAAPEFCGLSCTIDIFDIFGPIVLKMLKVHESMLLNFDRKLCNIPK